MADIEQGLVTYLLARAGVTALVAARIYPEIVPQAEKGEDNYPAITYQVISEPNVRSLSGASGLAYPRIQINCWSRRYSVTKALRNAVRDALDGYRGSMGDVTVHECSKESERTLTDELPATAGVRAARVYGRSMDFEIWYQESAPTFA